ncbi:MAG: hydrolase, partial [Balneolaceae bacterium]
LWHNPNTPNEESGFFNRTSRGIRISYPNYPFSARMSYRELGTDFNPDVGFTPRNAFRRLQPTIEYEKSLEKNNLIREIEFSLRHEYLADMKFRPLTVSTTFTPVDILFESTERIRASVSREFERLMNPFDIRRDGSIIIPAGDFNLWVFEGRFSTASFRKISGQFDASYGNFWTGKRTEYRFSTDLRPWPGVNLDANWAHTRVRLPEGDFKTNLFRFEANIDPTPSLSFTSNIQFDTLSDLLGLFSRVRWIITPGTDLFLVHTFNWISDEERLRPVSTGGTIKLSYTHRF